MFKLILMHQIVFNRLMKFRSTTSNINCNLIPKDLDSQDATLGQVWIGDPRKAICIPANSVKVVEGKTSKKARRLSCMIEARSQHNLLTGGRGQPYHSYSQQIRTKCPLPSLIQIPTMSGSDSSY